MDIDVEPRLWDWPLQGNNGVVKIENDEEKFTVDLEAHHFLPNEIQLPDDVDVTSVKSVLSPRGTLNIRADKKIANLLLSAAVVRSQSDPEESMTPAEMIQYWGYPLEKYDLITPDGYIISMLRISHPRDPGTANSLCHRPPILLVHGAFTHAAQWVMNPPGSSPGMILADAGFDVFMLNVRGTTHSRRHLTLTKDNRDYWKFTVDDMAKYDAPVAIDKALELNGATSLYYIGHSQGTIVGFLTLAENPAYNKKVSKVKALFQLSPAGTLHYVKGLAKLLIWLVEVSRPIMNMMGPFEVGMNVQWLLGGATKLFCPPILSSELCKDVTELFAGPTGKTINWVHKSIVDHVDKTDFQTRAPVYVSNFLVSTSSWNILQYMQMVLRNSVLHYNHSPSENMRRYGNAKALPYNYSNIESDIYMFWSRNDWATTPDEIEKWLIPHLRKDVIKGTFEIPEYSHAGYTIATDCGERIFSKIIRIVRKYELNACVE
ncbi:hypothetical protein PRIPAC_77144 [Pristionchus pacificus]|uniref:Hydrolase n=1 Tax=Pristionchus pacificus TaxID=54126 RepID=A0A2A6C446_PRIPA|nr:hypothetical protein PRIPAC_77144 [Pristionchus pacificus]|eukprot:PDM72791.1 hydrolase [Pristionchus pacificus]